MNHSDRYETLYSGSEGYVLYCRHCNRFRLAFISTALTLSEAEFAQFRNRVQMLCHQQASESEHANCKCIVIPSVSEKVQLVLTRKELVQLQQMLDRADTEQKVNALLMLFNS